MKSWQTPSLILGALLLATPHDPAEALISPEPTVPHAAAAATAPSGVATAMAALEQWAQEHHATLGALVVDLESGQTWGRSNPDAALNPASNQKVITAAAALKLLGPGYRYTTGVYGSFKDGVMARLVLRGHGDPTLLNEGLWRLARVLKARGLRRVDALLVDQSRFDDQFVPPAFEQQPNEWAAFRAPISAIALERNSVTLNVEAETEGKPARAWFEPDGFVTARGSITTSKTGSGQDVRLTLKPGAQGLEATLDGKVAEGLPRLQFARRVADPRLFAGAALRQLLTDMGVQVTGNATLGGADEKRRLAYVESEPLAVLVRELGKNSDNFYAEMLLKTLGAERKGTPATSRDGAAVVVDWLQSIGVADKTLRIENGSGLFDANRISASALMATLKYAYKTPAIQAEFVAQFAIGGTDGTLRSHFRDFAATRAIRAKTGTLDDVIALSGYVLRPDGAAPVAFALLLNGVTGKHAGARQHVEKVVASIAESLYPKR